jgi:hypothetical protein
MVDKKKLHHEVPNFFADPRRNAYRISAKPAIEICKAAANEGFLILGVEGGIWHDPGFGSRLDSLWGKVGLPVTFKEAKKLNEEAARFIEKESKRIAPGLGRKHDVFILTSTSFC